MKKLFMIITLGVTMLSCNNTPTDVENPKKVTTVELQQLANIDSTTYKVIEMNDVVYVMSTKDNTVIKKVVNESGLVETLVSIIFILLCILFVILLIIS